MRQKGFTIIELMIAVAIVAVLAAIALPNYSDYVRRGRITDATAALSSMRVKMEQHFQDNRGWTGACAAGTVSSGPGRVGQWNITCDTLAGDTFRVVATGVTGSSMDGATYTINQANVRTSTPPAGWSNSGCGWVIKKDGSC